MSGFIGIVSSALQKNNDNLLDRCQEEILSRCSDFSGKWKSSGIDLRFGLLKVTDDTSDEKLPFTCDDNLRIVGDVRLDRRTELVAELKKHFSELDISFPDSYLVLYSYKVWGEDCLDHMAGDYSFAIWNEKDQSLFCARDHFGLVPFYYSQTETGFLFTNYYRSLKHIPGLMDGLSEEVLKTYFLLGINGSFDQTIYQKIRKLPPAHKLVYKKGDVKITRYWNPSSNTKSIRYKTKEEYASHLERILERSVADRLRSSKVATQLSGGMDSSSVTAMAEKILSRKYGPEHTLVAYTITYKHLVREQEGRLAGLIAGYLKIPLRQFVAEDYLSKITEPMNSWIPEPAGIPQAVPEKAIVADAEDSGLEILLTGFGGDPLFNHDPRSWWNLFKQGHLLQPLIDLFDFFRMHGRFPLLNLKGRIKKLQNFFSRKNTGLPDWFDSAFISADYARSKINPSGYSPRSNFGMFGNPFWSFLFEKSHHGFSGARLKVRHPFFCLELVEFLQAVPSHLLYKKYLLRRAMLSYLPGEIIRRQKTVLYGGAHLQNLKSSGALEVLAQRVEDSQDFLKGKINSQRLMPELRHQKTTRSQGHQELISLLHILAWKNDC